jgi:hypothetical protein
LNIIADKPQISTLIARSPMIILVKDIQKPIDRTKRPSQIMGNGIRERFQVPVGCIKFFLKFFLVANIYSGKYNIYNVFILIRKT